MTRCLQKDPGKRLQHIDGARILIEEALTGETTASAIGVTSAAQPTRRLWAMAVGLFMLGAVVAVLVTWLLIQPSPPEQRLNKFLITPSPTAPLQNNFRNELAISPEGRHIVYTAVSQNQSQLYLRLLDDVVVTPISGTEEAQHPFFSPDGQSLAFFAAGELKKVPLTGGSAITLCDASGGGTAGSWGSGDTIVFSADSETATNDLYQVSAAGGERKSLTTPNPDKDENGYFSPQILPGGKAILFWIGRGPNNPLQTAVLSLETGEQKILLEGGRQARYLPTGHLIYEQAATGNLMAVAFDLATLKITGDSVPVLQEVRQDLPGYVDYALSDEGTLVYVPGLGASQYSYNLAWVDREGRETLVTQEKREYASPRISPDGKRVLFSMRQTGGSNSVTIYDLERDSFSRLTVDGTRVGSAIWTPDGKWITFQAVINGPRNIYRQLADRSALPEQLTTLADELSKQPTSWSPDGRVLTFNLADQNSNAWDIVILNKEENEEPQPFIASPNHECCARFSPDGKWLAYVSDELGRNQVYVRPYPGPDIKFLVSEEREGGGEPVWSPDGRELFYRSGDRMMVVSVQTEPTFRAGRPEVLFQGSYRATIGPLGYQYYDISPDGQRFLMIRRDEAPSYINVVLNWFEELKRLVPTP
jgi:serine/threonine-protein kinase